MGTQVITKPENRRRFLRNLSFGSIGAVTSSFTTGTHNVEKTHLLNRLKRPEVVDEDYWKMVKNQFTVDPNLIMVNSANLCPCPYFVNEAVERYSRDLARDVSFQYRGHFNEKRKMALSKLGKYLGTSSENIGITRNTSEANNIVVNGLDLKPEDEIIVWNQNHPSNLDTWKNRAKRYGFRVRVIETPKDPKTSQDLLLPFLNAITNRTKLISFSHVSNVSGIALPAKEICGLANAQDILTLVDGAQTVGFLDLNLEDLGCSFYTASSHKWLMGPMENGILFVNPDHESQLWPNIIAAGWKADSITVDEKLCVLGQRNTPSTAALPDIIDFHQTIGKTNIENRVRALNTHLKKSLHKALPNIQFVTPIEERLSGGVTIFQIPNIKGMDIFQSLYSDYGIASAPTGGVRISPTINSTMSDIDKVVEAVTELAG